jgi:sigma-E factor negative regulatory protein RseB
MLRRSLALFALAGACAAPWAGTTPEDATGQGPALDRQAVSAWLLRINEAAGRRNFQGTFVVSAGGSMSSARIAHYSDGPNQFERIDTMDGQLRRVFRHNDVVHTLWPKSHVALVEQRDLMSSFPALLKGGEDRIADAYEVHTLGNGRVAGHEASLLLVKPKDALRFGYKLWADKDSGLLLRAEVLGEHDEVLESSAFSDLTIGVRPEAQSVLQPMNRLDGYRVLRAALTPTRLEADGWSLRPPVPGFRQVNCVRRPLGGDADADVAASASHEVLQSIYSDGLTYVSVFIEPFDATRHLHPMQTASGATQTLMRRHGDAWVTVVGDVPSATLRLFAGALERKNQ